MLEETEQELEAVVKGGEHNSAQVSALASACRRAASVFANETALVLHPWEGMPSYDDWQAYIEADGCLSAFDLIADESQLLSRSVVDHLRAVGDLLDHGSSSLALATLSRSVLEAGLRLTYLLEPKTSTNERLQRAVNHRLARQTSAARLPLSGSDRCIVEASIAELTELANTEGWPKTRKARPLYGSQATVSELAERLDPGGLASFSWRVGSSVAHAELTSLSTSHLVEEGWTHASSSWVGLHTYGAPLGFGAAAGAIANYVEDAPQSWAHAVQLISLWSGQLRPSATENDQ